MSEIKIILQDTREQEGKHKYKEDYFKSQGIRIERCRLYVGDYTLPNNQSISIDTKKGCEELYSNMFHDHKRFVAETDRAVEAGIKLIVLVENKDGITCLQDIENWKNKQFFRYYKAKKQAEKKGVKFNQKPPVNNITFIKALSTMQTKHGVTFMFCKPEEAGAKIIELLGGGADG